MAAYRLYRDGAPIADTADVSYIDRSVANGVTYAYTLGAVDNAGNWSGLSSPAAYPPDGGGDVSGDGGTKMLKRHLSTAHGLGVNEYRERWNLGNRPGQGFAQ